jgi:tetratricopeptide (TPR) repeat protein
MHSTHSQLTPCGWDGGRQRNAGLLAFARKDLAAAQEAFGRAVEANPADVTSVNNYALCLMYQRNLLGATRYLEENLRVRAPRRPPRPPPVPCGYDSTRQATRLPIVRIRRQCCQLSSVHGEPLCTK